MLFFLQFNILPRTMDVAWSRADPTKFPQLAKVGFLRLHDTKRANASVARFTVAGVNGGLTSRHSWGSLLAVSEERKSSENDTKAEYFQLD